MSAVKAISAVAPWTLPYGPTAPLRILSGDSVTRSARTSGKGLNSRQTSRSRANSSGSSGLESYCRRDLLGGIAAIHRV
jgi:hypothetical protein